MPAIRDLRQRFLTTGAVLAAVVVLLLLWVASSRVSGVLQRQADERGEDLAARTAALVTQYLSERRREAELLASLPPVVAAAREAAQRAPEATGQPIADVERQFAGTRALGGPPEMVSFLRGYPARGDFAEVFFTDPRGFVVVSSGRTSDFVQSDEAWWQQAMADGIYEGEPQYDSSAAAVSLEYDIAVRATPNARPLGVLKAVFRLDRLAAGIRAADVSGDATLQVVDRHGHMVVTPDPADLLETLPNVQLIPRGEAPTVARIGAGDSAQLVVTVPAHDGRWWVVYRQPASAAYAAGRAAQRYIWLGALAVLVVAAGLLVGLATWLNQRVTQPVRAAGEIASRVAGGDLSVTLTTQRANTAEVGELFSSVHSMVVALRKLVGAIRSAADEAAAMAAEISASTQQMTASTEEMASTCQDLSKRAGDQATLVRAVATDAAQILEIATTLAAGAGDAAKRNAELAALARRHQDELSQSGTDLQHLADEVAQGAAEAEALSQASAEIQKFVAQTKAIATQTNMLALNAAIEAARAGQQGRGFAVVADEVRKLASHAAAAATETAETVRGVTARVDATRARLARLAQAGASAREAANTAAGGLAGVARAAEANDAWSLEIAASASEVRTLVEEIAQRMETLAAGTESLLASAEEIAASSQQQSASTEEIASSANQLATAADHLTGAVKTFRLVADDARQAAD